MLLSKLKAHLLCWGVRVVAANLIEAGMHVDKDGNLYINSSHSSDGQSARVFFNGQEVGPHSEALITLQSNAERLSTLASRMRRASIYGHGNHLMAVAGHTTGSFRLNSTRIFDGQGWQAAPAMPDARTDACVAVHAGEVYVAGGRFGGIMNDVQSFNGLSWVTRPALPDPRHKAACVFFRGELVLTGGSDGATRAHVFALRNGAWATLPAMPLARSDHAAVVYQDELHVLAGTTSSTTSVITSVVIFNGTTWRQGRSTIWPRRAVAAAVFNNRIYLGGGAVSGSVVRHDMAYFNGTTWSVSAAWPQALASAGMVQFQGQLWLLGGTNFTHVSARTYVLSPDQTTWIPSVDLPEPRCAAGFLVY
ncbi:uncharacterized protein MONBRDRAFT_30300 [Monosiga brevicollis MX1]|uniref:Uncharacterized protein n=1 Tax=Monosiga brevicollis TaxID=81824 RepID=A9VDK2_MONBE|nr:uncharacterized protein MONBRDRAFT_30300 [Monosiga brevicollis MX1]EDQ84409.1 predicted protein [Monosiga brevicollis MX1]|eukprot:XP_001750810.1 hypothetical protein [Monosiga brevicollis MX1]